MIEETLKTIISTIGVIYILMFIFSDMETKWFIIMSIVAFAMVIGILLMGKYTFGIW